MTDLTSPHVWLITGSSTGLGRALAEAALAQGDRVIITARNPDKIQDLEQQYPHTAKAARLDVTEPATIQTAVQSGLETFGRINVLVNNAGYGLLGAIEEVSDQQIRDQFETRHQNQSTLPFESNSSNLSQSTLAVMYPQVFSQF
jgi:NAD(P)-dependent dehydrogenase (short-subunit alcohol dehydrogenase family)